MTTCKSVWRCDNWVAMATDDMSHVGFLSPVHTNNNVEATFDYVAETAAMLNEFFVKFRAFDKVETN